MKASAHYPYLNIGAFVHWSQSKEDDEIFKVYRREYKKHFAWTKTEKVLRQHSTHGVKWLGRKRQRVKKDSRCRQRLQRESFLHFVRHME